MKSQIVIKVGDLVHVQNGNKLNRNKLNRNKLDP